MKKKVFAGILIAMLLLNVAAVAFGEVTNYKVTSNFMKLLDKNEIIYKYATSDGDDVISINDSGSYGDQKFIFFFNGSSVSLRVWDVIEFDVADRADVLDVCNNANYTWKYMRFYVNDSDNTVTMDFDMPLNDNEADDCFEILVCASSILSEVYPDLEGYAQ